MPCRTLHARTLERESPLMMQQVVISLQNTGPPGSKSIHPLPRVNDLVLNSRERIYIS